MKDLKLSQFDRRSIPGYTGDYIKSVYLDDGILTVLTNDDTVIPLGKLVPAVARNVTDAAINAEGVLVLTFDNGDVTELGYMANILRGEIPELPGDGLFSGPNLAFKPLNIDQGTLEPVDGEVLITANRIDQSVIAPGTVSTYDSIVHKRTLTDIGSSHSEPSVAGPQTLEWDDVVDGLITVPAGTYQLQVESVAGAPGTAYLEVQDASDDTVLATSNIAVRDKHVARHTSLCIRGLLELSVETQIRVVQYSGEASTAGLGHFILFPEAEGAAIRSIRLDRVSTDALTGVGAIPSASESGSSAVFTAYQDYLDAQPNLEYVVNTDWMAETHRATVKDVTVTGDYIYTIPDNKSFVFVYHSPTDKTTYVPVSTLVHAWRRVGTALIVITPDQVTTIDLGVATTVNVTLPLLTNSVLHATDDLVFTYNNTEVRIVSLVDGSYVSSLDVTATVPDNQLGYLTLPLGTVYARAGYWLVQYNWGALLMTPTTLVPTTVFLPEYASKVDINVDTLTAVATTGEYYNVLTPNNFNGLQTKYGFTITANTTLDNRYEPWFSMRQESRQTHGWLSRAGVVNIYNPGILYARADHTFTCNGVYLRSGSYVNTRYNEIKIEGYNGTNWVEVGSWQGFNNNELTLIFPAGDFTGTGLRVMFYGYLSGASYVTVSNFKLLHTTQPMERNIIPDLNVATTDITITGTEGVAGSELVNLSRHGYKITDEWSAVFTNTATIEVDLGKDVLVVGYAFVVSGVGTGQPKNWVTEGWNGAEWVVLDTVVGASPLGAGLRYRLRITEALYSKIRMVISGTSVAGKIGLARFEVLSDNPMVDITGTQVTYDILAEDLLTSGEPGAPLDNDGRLTTNSKVISTTAMTTTTFESLLQVSVTMKDLITTVDTSYLADGGYITSGGLNYSAVTEDLSLVTNDGERFTLRGTDITAPVTSYLGTDRTVHGPIALRTVDWPSGVVNSYNDVIRDTEGLHWITPTDSLLNGAAMRFYNEFTDEFTDIKPQGGLKSAKNSYAFTTPFGDGKAYVWSTANTYDVVSIGTNLVPYQRTLSTLTLEGNDLYNVVKLTGTLEESNVAITADVAAYAATSGLNNLIRSGSATYWWESVLNVKVANIIYEFDLPQSVDAIHLRTGYSIPRNADTITIAISDDGVNYTTVMTDYVIDNAKTFLTQVIPLGSTVTCKYIKYNLKNPDSDRVCIGKLIPLSTEVSDPNELIPPIEVISLTSVPYDAKSAFNSQVIAVTCPNAAVGFEPDEVHLGTDISRQDTCVKTLSGDLALTYEYATPVVVTELVMTSVSGYTPLTVTLEGSNDGTAWTDLGTFNGTVVPSYTPCIDAPVVNSTAYLYYRTTVTSAQHADQKFVHRLALITEDDIRTDRSLVKPVGATVGAPDYRVQGTDGSYYVWSQVGEFVTRIHPDGKLEHIATAPGYAHFGGVYDHINNKLCLRSRHHSTSNTEYITVIDDTSVVVRRANLVEQTPEFFNLLDGQVITYSLWHDSSKTLNTFDPSTFYIESLSVNNDSAATNLQLFRGYLAPDGYIYTPSHGSVPPMARYNPATNQWHGITELPGTTRYGKITATKSGDLLCWPLYTYSSDIPRYARISFPGATELPDAVVNSPINKSR